VCGVVMGRAFELIGKMSYIDTVFERVDAATLELLRVGDVASGLIVDVGEPDPEDVLSDSVSIELFHGS